MPNRRLFLILPLTALAVIGPFMLPAAAGPQTVAQASAGALSPAERQAIAEAMVDALDGLKVYDNGAVEEASGAPADMDGMPSGLMDYVQRTKQLPPGLQQLVIDAVEVRLPGRRAQLAGVSLVLRDAAGGAIVGTVGDVLALRRSLSLRN
ncbi:MAG: hypothetical protein AB7G39_00905 [Alphaproteobacteria bacterium]